MGSDQRQQDVSRSKVFFRRAVRISSTSVFFTPKEGESLDFQTVCSAPKAHRELLQKNGMIAKVMLSISSSSLGDFSSHQSRLRIWWKVLLNNGLVQPDTSSVTVPVSMENELWPIVDETTFTARMNMAVQRLESEKFSECPFIVPVLSVEEFVYKEPDMMGTLGVIWMPNYTCNLRQWSESQLSKRYIPELTLCALINQMIIALLALKTSNNNFSSSYFFMEDILVAVTNSEEEPTFVLNILGFQEEERHQQQIFLTQKSNMSNHLYPFLPPEVIINSSKPFGNTKYDIWALGMVVYRTASGCSQTSKRLFDISHRILNRIPELPLNHTSLTPSDIIRRVRRDLQPGPYSNPFIHLVIFMLAQDPLTRPTIRVLDQILQGILRHKPILRFPFAIGSFDLLRVLHPENVLIDPVKGLYIMSTECVLCKRRRSSSYGRSGSGSSSNMCSHPACGPNDHRPAVCSPLWSTDELLPGYIVTKCSQMTYLSPLVGKVEDKEKRRCIEAALREDNIDRDSLLQLFGGFAVLEANNKGTLTTREVMVPIPCNVLYKKEKKDVITTISFTAALPWPSQCTHQLQQEGRIQRAVPALFSIRNVYWYAWILPGETFLLGENKWMPAADGAFVFWFSENLTPTEQDRYFLVCSVQSLTLQAKVETTALPDHSFQRGEGYCKSPYHSPSESSFVKMISYHQDVRKRRNHAARRRCTNISIVNVPIGQQVKEAAAIEINSTGHLNSPSDGLSNINKENILNGSISLHCRLSKKSSPVRMNYIEDIGCKEMRDPQINLHDAIRSPSLATLGAATLENWKEEKEANNIQNKNIMINQKPTELVEISPNGCAVSIGEKKQSQPSEETVAEETIPYRTAAAVSPLIPKASVEEKEKAREIAEPTLNASDAISSPQPKIQKSRLLSTKTPLRIFGRWYEPQCVDADYQSLTFCIPETGEHGRLSQPVPVPVEMRGATHAPSTAVNMAFCANEVPIIRRNHPECTMALPPPGVSSMIPHHGLVFYDAKNKIVGLLAFRFATTSYPNLALGELLLPFRFHPHLIATSSLLGQLNPVYFTGNAVFEDSAHGSRCCLKDEEKTPTTTIMTSGGAAAELLRHSSTSGVARSLRLSITGAGLTSFGDPNPRCTHSDDDALPVSWLGFDPISQRLMLADVQQEVWHPIRFTAEE
ncbi:uncharacterized protein TM35_000052590 [Trypanosoma theileri]|uniref:Protein kinase domain-containing protein n=1 Tax=Trypanosoma theileri TaxID=67003 RepID=A0A1X0P4T4_9TRYP|nr:uncharacterized protein TM35_000052590 [Trypanosoma theileri]ORC91663.1 hypothetical protein TM35_000052590 [Trypanosoma theileri]